MCAMTNTSSICKCGSTSLLRRFSIAACSKSLAQTCVTSSRPVGLRARKREGRPSLVAPPCGCSGDAEFFPSNAARPSPSSAVPFPLADPSTSLVLEARVLEETRGRRVPARLLDTHRRPGKLGPEQLRDLVVQTWLRRERDERRPARGPFGDALVVNRAAHLDERGGQRVLERLIHRDSHHQPPSFSRCRGCVRPSPARACYRTRRRPVSRPRGDIAGAAKGRQVVANSSCLAVPFFFWLTFAARSALLACSHRWYWVFAVCTLMPALSQAASRSLRS